MTDITELAKSLKAAAENAGADCWQAKKISGDFYVIRKGSYKRECGYTTYQPIAEIDHKPTRDYVAMANPTNILALVEALEKAQSKIIELQQGYEIDPRTHEIIDLQERQLAKLESRTVKLPPCVDDLHGIGMVMSADAVVDALAAAGIKVEAE
ncbi:hypothetical protein B6J45_13130 [Klebsiella pneumoniae]|uniref:ead/Ea22-like family protein n=1 Tax=Klebsiella pneumoniae TaxID=573 RepID=UPI000C7B9942|nr:ead/Ea22-like family protein [Klebsiella pneumoniae]PLI34507.1 hypothetical protein B6J45_13130 [Klebsiella pneumoniae]